MSSDIHALSGAYAIDALDGQERDAFERHLAGCAACQAEVDSLREAATSLADTVATTPPAHLRASVLDNIAKIRPLPPVVSVGQRRPARHAWLGGALIAAAAIALFAIWAFPRTPSKTPVVTAAEVVHAQDTVKGQSITVNTDPALLGQGSVVFYRATSLDKAAVSATDLPALPAGKTYELWLQLPGSTMQPAGWLHGGSSLVVLKGAAATATQVGITVEPIGGSPTPTLPAVSLAEFPRT